VNPNFHIGVKKFEDIGEDIPLSLLKIKPKAGVSETPALK
jgi:hypothetical protein